MKFTQLAALASFVSVVVSAPTLEDRPVDDFTLAARQGCYVPSTPDTWVIDTVYNIAKGRGADYREMLATFETMRVESNYHNLDCGDADSIGVFQQRPSMEVWGSYSQIKNVPHAANKFLDAMFACSNKHPGLTAGQIAQCAQVSAIPTAYDRAEQNARAELQKAVQRNGGSTGGSGGASNVGSTPGSSGGGSSGGSSGGSTSSGTSGCARTVKAVGGDTCAKVAGRGSISVSTLRSLNSSINGGCTNLQVGKSYCVARGSGSSSPAPSSGSGSTSSGACKKWSKAVKGDNCAKMAGRGKSSVSKFLSLNKGVNKACTNIQLGKSYCIA